MSEYGIVLFDTTQAAIKAEKALNQAGIKTKLIPVPRHISSNCGISLRFDVTIMAKVEAELVSKGVPISAIIPLDR
jgi:putative Se/S carrier protein